LYYQRVPTGKEYPILCRRLESNGGFVKTILGLIAGDHKEEILLDWNEIAEQYGMSLLNLFFPIWTSYVHVGTCRVSPNHNFLAYTLDIDGRELFTLWIKDLKMGSLIEKSSAHGVASLAWAEDSNALMYTVVDETRRPYRVLYSILGSNNVDTLLFEENDANYCTEVMYMDVLFLTQYLSHPQVYVVSTTKLKEGLQLVQKREYGVQCFLEHHHGYFYILTNFQSDKASASEGYHIARCAVENFPSGDWQSHRSWRRAFFVDRSSWKLPSLNAVEVPASVFRLQPIRAAVLLPCVPPPRDPCTPLSRDSCHHLGIRAHCHLGIRARRCLGISAIASGSAPSSSQFTAALRRRCVPLLPPRSPPSPLLPVSLSCFPEKKGDMRA
ncbi:Protease 2, partial [Nymphaea thermarum]